MEMLDNANKEDGNVQKERHNFGPEGEGKEEICSNELKKEKEENDIKTEIQVNPEQKKKGSTISNLRNFVRGRSKSRDGQVENVTESLLNREQKEHIQSRNSFSKLIQNVSTRVWGSSSSTEVTGPEVKQEERCGSQGKLGKMFRRKSMSKTDLDTDPNTEELGKMKTLGRLFGRRSNSKTDVMSNETNIPELKSLTLGRRISSTFRGAFGKTEPAQQNAQEVP